MVRTLFFNHILLPRGWAQDTLVSVDDRGDICAIETGVPSADVEQFDIGFPGIVNAHSHAFQRAMAGLAEYGSEHADNFWTWRDVMYRFAAAMTPQDQLAVSTYLQVELLKQGFTSLVEFHYLHNRPDGSPYSCPAEMSLATLEAARLTGMGLTHLPVLYMTAGLDGAPLKPHQTMFMNGLETCLNILSLVEKAASDNKNIATGLAAHSLRAVPPAALHDLITAHQVRDAFSPFHIHIAEQMAEVDDCLRYYEQRPVDWLLDHADVNQQWTLIHSTHVTPDEVKRLAASGATVAICPTTEANLGDGIFPLPDFLASGGRIAIGTDSHVSTSPWEELRWLEYVQRLVLQGRNIAATSPIPHTGTSLFRQIQGSAAQVTGRPVGEIAAGARADLIVLDDRIPQFAGRTPDQRLDTAIFGGIQAPARHVMVGGEWLVRDGHHAGEDAAAKDYRTALKRLAGAL